MFAMRLKLGSIRNKEWRCCFCLHVRTATVAFGIWHLILHVLALTILALIMRNHNIFMQNREDFEQDFLPTPLSKIKNEDNPYYLPTTQDGRPILPTDIDMGALLTICTLAITLLMVYGTLKGKPKHLLPFFCLQLFDFAITALTATGYFCYLRSVHRLVAEHWHNLPFRQELLSLSPQYLSLLVLTSFLISMVWKAYWIGVVWRCYKYLTLKQQASRNTIHYILPGVDGAERTDVDYPSLFRDSEGGFGPLKQTPPPSYHDVMGDQPPPYPTSLTVEETPARFVFTYSADNANRESTSASTPASPKPEDDPQPTISATVNDEPQPSTSTANLDSPTPAEQLAKKEVVKAEVRLDNDEKVSVKSGESVQDLSEKK